MSHGNPGVFFTRPIALLFMLLTALSIFLYARSMLRARRAAAAPSNPAAGATS
jgi:TctA family transporter